MIIGTGKYNVEFEEEFFEYFRTHKIIVETMPTVKLFILLIFSLKL